MPLRKKPACVIAFSSTSAAMAAEACFQERGLPGRIIPLPREISESCGLSWKADPGDEETLTKALDAAGIAYDRTYLVTI